MSSLRIDLHTHNFRCGHATGTMEEYVQAAIALGIEYIGFSDHSPLWALEEDDPMPGMHMAKSEFKNYYETMHKLKEEYADRITVLAGLEVDYIEGKEAVYENALKTYQLDFIIGSVHYFDGYHIFDKQRWQQGTPAEDIYEKYFSLVQKSAQLEMFDIIAHMDAIKAFGPPPTKNFLQPLIDQTIEIISTYNKVVEINASGLLKCNELFPSRNIVKKLQKKDILLTYGSDAHSPEKVGHGWQETYELLSSLGIHELVILKNREIEAVTLLLDNSTPK